MNRRIQTHTKNKYHLIDILKCNHPICRWVIANYAQKKVVLCNAKNNCFKSRLLSKSAYLLPHTGAILDRDFLVLQNYEF